MKKLPWNELVPTISINPASASNQDIARLASELMDCHQMDRMKTSEISLLVKENNSLLQRMATAHSILVPLGQAAIPNLAIHEALRILKP